MKLSLAEKKFIKALGLKIRSLRNSKGWTLEEAEEKGWSNWRHLQKIEVGKNITVLTLHRVAKLYGIEVSELLENVD